jgi:hypothetical protein
MSHHRRRPLPVVVLASIALLLSRPAGAQLCAERPGCAEVGTFVASVAEFRTSLSGRSRIATVTVRFRNKTTRTLRLAYVQGSGVVLDDQGNRYLVPGAGSVRAIGEANDNSFDPKFSLEPGESSDARFEFAWAPERAGQIVGTTFEGDLTVREIDPVAGNQFRLGREHALHFRALGGGTVAANPNAPSTTPNSAPNSAPNSPILGSEVADACAGRARCYSTGPFIAEVTSVVPSIVSRHRMMRVELKIQNRSTQPLILGYKSGSSSMVDDLGNRYYFGRAGTHDMSAQGIGLVTGAQADPQFALRPGESRRAAFNLIRYDSARQPLGASFSYDVALEQLEVLPSSQVRTVREYTVSFPGIGTGSAPTAASTVEAVEKGKALIDRLRGRKPKP